MQRNYEKIAAEDFENVQDLFAAILSAGIASQLKQGLYRKYINESEVLPVLHGKIDIQGTIRQHLRRSNKLSCEYDELSENNYMNQILKATAALLISCGEVKPDNKAVLKKCMLYFSEVDSIEPSAIDWRRLRYHRNNQTYRMLMNICYLVLSLRIASEEKGAIAFTNFFDSQEMWRLYEKFIFEYYRKPFLFDLIRVSAPNFCNALILRVIVVRLLNDDLPSNPKHICAYIVLY
jgi:5-methylcytosine-specific restriction enzyme subunit McrC